ncbi:MAG: hypothetical protein IJC68_01525 [Firmicutes bacterium]|nr:hypothetical protein [Bacillota bacterium]
MTITIILWLSMIWMPFLISGMMRNEAKFKKNIAIGVTFPIDGRMDPEVQQRLARFIKELRLVTIGLVVIALPCLFVKSFSLTMTLWLIWIDLCILAPYIPYVLCNRDLKALKREKGWAQAPQTSISVDLSLIPEERRLSPWLYVPAFLLGLLPLLWDLNVWPVVLVDSLLVLFSWFGDNYLYRNKAEKVDENADLTRALTRIRRRNWSLLWLLCAYSFALLSISMSLYTLLPLLSGILFFLIVVGIVIAVLLVEFRTRTLQEKLTASSGSGSYVDEDDYWLGGVLYCNPKDSRTIVNYRVGTNTTVNIARPAGKVFMIFTLVLLLALPFTGLILDAAVGGPMELIITEETADEEVLLADCGGTAYEIPLDSIESVQLLEELPKRLARTWGTATENFLGGNFSSKTLGSLKVCLDPTVKPFLLIEAGGKTYLLGSRDAAETRALYETLKEVL